MTSRIQFIPAATETLVVAGNAAQTLALPAVDGGNTDLTITHTNGSPIYLSFGPGAVAGPNVLGQITALPGYSTLLTGNAAVLAVVKDNLVQGGPQAAAAGSGTVVSVWSPGACQVTLTRGTASAVQSF